MLRQPWSVAPQRILLESAFEAQRRFVQVELEIAKALIEGSKAESTWGHMARADDLYVKADRARQRALKWIGRAEERGIEVHDERHAAGELWDLFVSARR